MRFFILVILIFINYNFCFAQSGHSVFVEEFKKHLQLSDQEAAEIADAVYAFIHSVEGHFINCSLGKLTQDDKIELSQMFMPDAKIQVSTKGKSTINTYLLDKYLERLGKQARGWNIKLFFDKRTLKFSNITDNSDGTYSFSSTIYQIYKGCKKNERNDCYDDVTKKKFNWLISKDNDGNTILQIIGITVSETLTAEQYYKK